MTLKAHLLPFLTIARHTHTEISPRNLGGLMVHADIGRKPVRILPSREKTVMCSGISGFMMQATPHLFRSCNIVIVIGNNQCCHFHMATGKSLGLIVS
jgi:hypothetical protein